MEGSNKGTKMLKKTDSEQLIISLKTRSKTYQRMLVIIFKHKHCYVNGQNPLVSVLVYERYKNTATTVERTSHKETLSEISVQ